LEDGGLVAAGHGDAGRPVATWPPAEQWISPASLSQTGEATCREALPALAASALAAAGGVTVAARRCTGGTLGEARWSPEQ